MRSALAVLCVVLLAGCGTKVNPAAEQPAKTVVTPDMHPDGRVQSVNAESRFIIVRFPPSNVASAGTQLSIYHGGLKSGIAKVTGPEMDGNTVADIVSGDVAVGDEARQE